MTSVTYPEFHADTESLEVAKAFGGSIRGKSIIVTGVNRSGIGYTTALALVRGLFLYWLRHLLTS